MLTQSLARRRSTAYVNKILKGDKPVDLPVEQPTKFELVINLRSEDTRHRNSYNAASRADEVIE